MQVFQFDNLPQRRGGTGGGRRSETLTRLRGLSAGEGVRIDIAEMGVNPKTAVNRVRQWVNTLNKGDGEYHSRLSPDGESIGIYRVR